MKQLAALISPEDAWSQVQSWSAAATRPVELIPCTQVDGEATLLALQITTRSVMGAVALHCGGVVVDRGWLRILGAGNAGASGLRDWNETLGGQPLDPPEGAALVVGYDALGGFFAINGGRWPERPGGVHYLRPDAGGWQALDMGYGGLVQWAMSAEVDAFYGSYRWPGWESEVAGLGAEGGILVYPPLGFESTAVVDRSRRVVPIRELWTLHHELFNHLGRLAPGASAQIDVNVERPRT